MRLRAYTTLLMAYDDARRAIQYLRSAMDDADDIAPGLHPGRPGRRSSVPEVAPPPVCHAEFACRGGSACAEHFADRCHRCGERCECGDQRAIP
jgi:hypothetical protein